jgi:hypothetical protein
MRVATTLRNVSESQCVGIAMCRNIDKTPSKAPDRAIQMCTTFGLSHLAIFPTRKLEAYATYFPAAPKRSAWQRIFPR